MIRTIALSLAAALLLLTSAVGLSGAQAQQSRAPTDLNQSLLDKWMVVMPGVVKLGRSSTNPANG